MPTEGDARPFSKAAQLARGPKRYRRSVAGRKRRAEIVAAKSAPCRICGRVPVSFHHLVPRGAPYFGDDTEANWIPLCGSGTTGCHGLVEARDPDASRALLAALSDAEYSYAIHRGGEAFFERRYRLVYDRT